jgi:hypothetical protein
MQSERQQDEYCEWWLVAAVCFAALTASIANLLNYGEYTRVGWEIVIVIAGCAPVAIAMALIVRLAQPRLSFLFIGLFIALFADFNAELSAPWFLVIAAVAAGLARFRETATVKLAGVIFATILVFQSFELMNAGDSPTPERNEAARQQDPQGVDRTRPAIVHLMLDAYMGIEGMQVEGTDFGNLHAEQTAFFERHGFTVYPQAYSQHVKTVNSLPHIFSYGKAPLATTSREVQYLEAPPLDYFADLDRRGYSISAATPSFVDLCVNQPMTHCANYNRSQLGDLIDLELGPFMRARIIAHTAAQLSQVSGKLVESTGLTINRVFGTQLRRPYNETKLFPISAMKRLESFTADLETLEFGEVRLVHLLVPHDPYVYRPDCSTKPYGEWLDEHGPGSIAAREKGYADQVRCLQQNLEDLIAALEKTPAGRSAIVVIHGDHGARTIDVVPFKGGPQLSAREMAMAHSTMFAVRLPGRAPDTRFGRYSVSALMRGFERGDFRSVEMPPETPARYYLMDADWIPSELADLPDFRPTLTKH